MDGPEQTAQKPAQKPAVAKKAPVQPKPQQQAGQQPLPPPQAQPVQQRQPAMQLQQPAQPQPQAVAQAPAPAVKGNATLKDVQALRDRTKAAPIFKVKTAGRPGTSKLGRTPSQVPVIDWTRFKVTKNVPRLDIGTETLISREDFQMETLNWGARSVPDLKPEASPKAVSETEIAKLLGQKPVKAGVPRQLEAKIRPVGQPLSKEMVDAVQYAITDVPEFIPMPYKPLSDEEMKMMAALILFDKGGHCHMVMGLFHQLAEAPKTKSEATFHLGACASQLKMNQAAFQHLSTLVASEDKEYGAQALEIMSLNLPYQYEMEFYRLLRRVGNMPKLVTEKAHDTVYYRMAKGAYKNGAIKTSLGYSAQVSDKSEFVDDNRFLAAMVTFAAGDKTGALTQLQALWDSLEARKVQDKNIRALTSVNLARMHFAQKQYDKALENYMRVPKDHALWVQALIEQGWTQLALEDFSGAIGNMYSLHSPYFKAVYQPESFVVRTIGYLNICQYGDAYKSLSWLEKDYRSWADHLATYAKNKSTPADVYATVKTYIRGKSTDDVDGVPFQVWRELARRKDFLNQQTALNEKQDEGVRYEGVNEKIKKQKAGIRDDAASAKTSFDNYKGQLAKAKAAKKAAGEIEKLVNGMQYQRELAMGYRYQLYILELSRAGYLDFQKKAQANVDGETQKLTANAGNLLMKRAKEMQAEMARVLDNNEFLRYEVFAGSGENIRYQVAGGKIDGTNRIPASIKPTKMMNWSFDGEFWKMKSEVTGPRYITVARRSRPNRPIIKKTKKENSMKNVKHLGLIGLMTLGFAAHAKTDVAAGLTQLKTNETNAKANQKQYDENGEIASKNIVEVTAAIKTLRDQKTTLNSNAANLEKNRAVLTKMEERLNTFTKDEDAQMKKEAAQIAQLKATLEKLEANQVQRQKNMEVYQQKIAEVQKERADWESQKQAFVQIQKELDTKEGKALAEREKWIEKRKGYRGEAGKWEKESKIAEEHRVKFDRLAK